MSLRPGTGPSAEAEVEPQGVSGRARLISPGVVLLSIRQGPVVAGSEYYSPLHTGWRFSKKACMPSWASQVMAFSAIVSDISW